MRRETSAQHTQGWNQICLLLLCSSGSYPLSDPLELQSGLQTGGVVLLRLNLPPGETSEHFSVGCRVKAPEELHVKRVTKVYLPIYTHITLLFQDMMIFFGFIYPALEICCWDFCTMEINWIHVAPSAVSFPFLSRGNECVQSGTCGFLYCLRTSCPLHSAAPSIIQKGYESFVLNMWKKKCWIENTVAVYLLRIKLVIKVYSLTCAKISFLFLFLSRPEQRGYFGKRFHFICFSSQYENKTGPMAIWVKLACQNMK